MDFSLADKEFVKDLAFKIADKPLGFERSRARGGQRRPGCQAKRVRVVCFPGMRYPRFDARSNRRASSPIPGEVAENLHRRCARTRENHRRHLGAGVGQDLARLPWREKNRLRQNHHHPFGCTGRLGVVANKFRFSPAGRTMKLTKAQTRVYESSGQPAITFAAKPSVLLEHARTNEGRAWKSIPSTESLSSTSK